MQGPFTENDRRTVENALFESGVLDKIRSLEHGIDTTLTREFDPEGAVLSGGETQKVQLAAVFAKYPGTSVDVTPGSVTVLGLMNDVSGAVRLIIDEDILKDLYIGCHPCINTSSLKIRMDDVLQKIFPALNHEYTVVDLENTEGI